MHLSSLITITPIHARSSAHPVTSPASLPFPTIHKTVPTAAAFAACHEASTLARLTLPPRPTMSESDSDADSAASSGSEGVSPPTHPTPPRASTSSSPLTRPSPSHRTLHLRERLLKCRIRGCPHFQSPDGLRGCCIAHTILQLPVQRIAHAPRSLTSYQQQLKRRQSQPTPSASPPSTIPSSTSQRPASRAARATSPAVPSPPPSRPRPTSVRLSRHRPSSSPAPLPPSPPPAAQRPPSPRS